MPVSFGVTTKGTPFFVYLSFSHSKAGVPCRSLSPGLSRWPQVGRQVQAILHASKKPTKNHQLRTGKPNIPRCFFLETPGVFFPDFFFEKKPGELVHKSPWTMVGEPPVTGPSKVIPIGRMGGWSSHPAKCLGAFHPQLYSPALKNFKACNILSGHIS